MFAFTLLFVATQIQIHNITTSAIHFAVANDTYIPNGLVEITMKLNPYLPSYTHKAELSEYITAPLRPGNHTIHMNWITVVPQLYMSVYNASGDMLLSLRATSLSLRKEL
jgi:hypothetical protein